MNRNIVFGIFCCCAIFNWPTQSRNKITYQTNQQDLVRELTEEKELEKAPETALLEIPQLNKTEIKQISQLCKKRKRLFLLIRTGAFIGGIGFIAWKLFGKKNKQLSTTEQIESLTARVQALEDRLELAPPTPHTPSTQNWLIQETKALGSHAGSLIVDGLISTLVVDTVTGSVTNAITKRLPLNELLARKPSLEWLLQNHTNYAVNTRSCLYILKDLNVQMVEEQELQHQYLWYHAQSLIHDLEKILGFLAFEIDETTNQHQKQKLSILAGMLFKTGNLFSKKMNATLRQPNITATQAAQEEIQTIQNIIEEIQLRTQKRNNLLPQLF